MLMKMLTGLVALALSGWRRRPPRDQAPAKVSRPAARLSHASLLPEDRARFIAMFLRYAFHGRSAVSVFSHADKPFPEALSGGKVENVRASKAGDGWLVTFGLNHRLWTVRGHVDIELERDTPALRIDSCAGCGASIQMMFVPEGGYGDDYDLWAAASRALDDCEYFEPKPGRVR